MSRTITGPYSTEPGPRRRWGDFVVMAQDGMVVIRDEREGDVDAITVGSARYQHEGFVAELAIVDRQRQSVDQAEKKYAISYYPVLRQWCEILDQTIKDARAQGDPTDAAVRKIRLTTFLRSRRHQGLVSSDGACLPAPDTLFKMQAAADANPRSFPVLPRPHQPIAVEPPETPPRG